MKKAILTIISVSAIIFCLVSAVLPRHKADLYSALYKQNVTIEKADEKKVELKKGDFFVFGKIYGEDIVWEIVNDSETPLAWSKNAICFRAYDDKSSDWITSDLREWLNSESGFLSEENFSSTDIVKQNEDGDTMFILSKKQLQFFKESKRAKSPTSSAIRNDGSNKLVIRKNCWYWTSSSIETNSSSVAAVTQSGGFYKTLPTDTLMGVCPAFYLESKAVTICGGNGTKEKPYVVNTVEFGEVHNGIE